MTAFRWDKWIVLAAIFKHVLSTNVKIDMTDTENSIREGPDNGFSHERTGTCIHNESYGLPSKSNWTEGVQLLLGGGPYQYL